MSVTKQICATYQIRASFAVPYKSKKSPFGRPHILGKKLQLSYAHIHVNYKHVPNVISKGGWVADTKKFISGECVDIKNNVIYIMNTKSSRKKGIKKADALPCPVQNSFIQNTDDDTWMHVATLGPKFAYLQPVNCKKPIRLLTNTPLKSVSGNPLVESSKSSDDDDSTSDDESGDDEDDESSSTSAVDAVDESESEPPQHQQNKTNSVNSTVHGATRAPELIKTRLARAPEKKQSTASTKPAAAASAASALPAAPPPTIKIPIFGGKDASPVATIASHPPVAPDKILPRMVLQAPKEHLEKFLHYWGASERRPDLSLGRSPDPKKLQFWLQKNKNLKAHTSLPGMCAKWTHIAIDFAISQNKWPVKFARSDAVYDMTIPFALTVWVCYTAQMHGQPSLKSKACQKVMVKQICVLKTRICVLKPVFVF